MELVSEFQTTVRRAFDEIDENWEKYPGLVVCGTHDPLSQDIEGILEKIKHAREEGLPFLGICFGHQLAAIEYARNVMGIKDATSEEFGRGTFVVRKLDDLNVGYRQGENYWNHYYVSLPNWEKAKNFITTQYHPEYASMIDRHHPVLIEFIHHAKMAMSSSS